MNTIPNPKTFFPKISFAAPREESILEDLDGGEELWWKVASAWRN
jgi:hypothetical protein